MLKQLCFLALAHLVTGAAVPEASINSVTLNVENKRIAPDGFSRSTILANGVYPNPLIRATKGQTLRITVNNRLTDPTMRRSTALNLDGIHFTGANSFNEGEPFVNACPIAPQSSYTYEAPLGTQTGTHWYHSELSVQYVDGFRGPLVIYDPLDPQRNLYDVDDESTIIQVGDWSHNSSVSALAGFVATGIVPVPDTGTVNGVGRFQNGPAVPWSVINVIRGKRYRFRLINESGRSIFNVSFDNHDMTIIEADGIATQPHTVKKIEMLAGQRYSVIVNANQPIGNYWFNAPFVGGLPSRNPNQNNTLSRAILRYVGAPRRDPTTPMTMGPETGLSVEADLRPLVPTPVSDPDVILTLNLAVTAGAAQWKINGVSYLPPKEPTLDQVLDGATATSDFNATENTFVLPKDRVVEVRFPSTGDDDAHPFHLHGMSFQVIKSMSSPTINTVNPISRDVMGVGSQDAIIRFRTPEVGAWLFHCHIFWHKFAGLATVQLVDPAAARATIRPNRDWQQLCPAYDALPADQQ